MIDRGNSDYIPVVGIPVIVTIVVVKKAIPSRPDINISFSIPPLRDSIDDRRTRKRAWAFESFAVVIGSPAIVINVDIFVVVRKRIGFHLIGCKIGDVAQGGDFGMGRSAR